MVKFKPTRDKFIKEFSLKDYNELVDGWDIKVVRCTKGEQGWGLFKAVKEWDMAWLNKLLINSDIKIIFFSINFITNLILYQNWNKYKHLTFDGAVILLDNLSSLRFITWHYFVITFCLSKWIWPEFFLALNIQPCKRPYLDIQKKMIYHINLLAPLNLWRFLHEL